MKKIGIDARLYSQTGVGTYLQNLLYYLDKKNNFNFKYFIYLTENDYNDVIFKSPNLIKKKADFKWHTFSEQINFLWLLLKDNLDLMHFTYFSYPFFYPKPFIVTLHDLTPLLFKTGKSSTKNKVIYSIKHIAYRLGLFLTTKRAKAIITPTLTVKNQLLKHFSNLGEKDVFYIYEGLNYKFLKTKENESLKNKLKNKKYFLYVGNFYPHKNIERLIQAFKRVNKNFNLILAGPRDFFSNRISDYICKLKLNYKIKILYNPKISDLIFLYKNAFAFVNPSLSEGFGLPLIEASYFNCPVIASNIDVFKEILDNQYLAFDPYSVNDIANKINFFIQKKPKFLNKNLIKKYSFEKMTQATNKIYEQILI